MAFVAAGLCAGIFVCAGSPDALSLCVASAASAAAAAVILFLARNKFSRRWLGPASLAVAVPAGALLFGSYSSMPPRHVSFLPEHDGIRAVTGKVCEPVRFAYEDDNPFIPDFTRGNFLVEAESVEIFGDQNPVCGKVRVSFYKFAPQVELGDTVRLSGQLRKVDSDSPSGRALVRDGVTRSLSLRSDSAVTVLSSQPSLARSLARMRERLRERVRAVFPEKAGRAVASLVLGVGREIPPRDREHFSLTGTAHFFAVSGLHLAFLMAAAWFVLTRLGASPGVSAISVCALTIFYMTVVGYQPPVARSGVMALSYAAGEFIGRRKNVPSALGVAATILLALDPSEAFNIGFQLSFSAVFSMVLFYPAARSLLPPPPKDDDPLTPPSKAARFRYALTSHVKDGFCASLAAWLGTAPLVLIHFNMMTPATVAMNILMAPFVSALMIVGFACLPFLYLPAAALIPFAYSLEYIYMALTWLAEVGAHAPFGGFYWCDARPWALVAYCAALLAAGEALWRLREFAAWKKAVVCAAFAGGVLLLAMTGFVERPADTRMTVFDTGKGSSIAISFSDGRLMVYDCGSDGLYDPGRTTVARGLWERGHRKIDVLVLSHPDPDHISGALSLIARFAVGRIVVGPDFEMRPDGELFRKELDDRLIDYEWQAALAGDEIMSGYGYRVEALYPGPAYDPRGGLSENDQSLAVMVEAGKTVLLAGDLERPGLKRLAKVLDGAVDILVVPHHGGSSSLEDGFIEKVRPGIAVFSASKRFVFWKVVEKYRQIGSAIMMTAETGDVEISIDR